MIKKTLTAIGIAAIASAVALPAAIAAPDSNTSVQIAQCSPCKAKTGCNPCAAKTGCNPCAAKKGCNPCAATNPCNPCAAKKGCNPCAAKK